MKRSVLSFLATCFAVAAMAQSAHWCDTDRRIHEEMAKDPDSPPWPKTPVPERDQPFVLG